MNRARARSTTPKPNRVSRGRTRADNQSVPVVGIGASTGGLDALTAFFGAVPPASGLVFVVVHTDPTHASRMQELLANATTALRVRWARDRQPLEANHAYIVPPNRSLTFERGLLRVRPAADRGSGPGTIDSFFRSLAANRREQAIAVVLSGTGTGGTLGARAVRAEGGLVMAQAPETAVQPGMPASAIATGLVDVLLAPEKLPCALLDYIRHARLNQAAPPAAVEGRLSSGLKWILSALRARADHDFLGYRTGTLQRRIERRMGLHQIGSPAAYAALLRAHGSEADQLIKDLLIGVTSFFRDASAFERLTGVLAGMVRRSDEDTPVRIWVPGCAAGEEAYSIAMIVAEQIQAGQSACRMRIFATDIEKHALAIARGGAYPESIALDVTPSRLQRFFTHEEHRYTVVDSLRRSVTFGAHDLIRDPPFSRLDLVSCRNVLTYLNPEVQEKILGVFHSALNPGGHLFLGRGENVGSFEDLFVPISKRLGLFRRVEGVGRRRAWGRRAGVGQQNLARRLESTNKEILSMNKELMTLNADLHDRVRELTAVNDDLRELLASAEIASVRLDAQLRVTRFTTAATRVLNLLPSDVGRPIAHITTNLVDVDLAVDARTVLDSLTAVEREVASRNGRHYLVRTLPSRPEGTTAQGVVLTVADVTTLKHAKRRLRALSVWAADDRRPMARQHQVGARLAGPGTLQHGLEEAVRASEDTMGAEMGTIQGSDDADKLTTGGPSYRVLAHWVPMETDDEHAPHGSGESSPFRARCRRDG